MLIGLRKRMGTILRIRKMIIIQIIINQSVLKENNMLRKYCLHQQICSPNRLCCWFRNYSKFTLQKYILQRLWTRILQPELMIWFVIICIQINVKSVQIRMEYSWKNGLATIPHCIFSKNEWSFHLLRNKSYNFNCNFWLMF